MNLNPIAPFSLLAAALQPAAPVTGEGLHDIKDIVPLPRAWPWWPWLLGGALLVLALVVFFLVRSRKKGHPAAQATSPDQAALRALAEAMTLVQDGDAKRFAVLVTDILRRYIEARFGLRAPALTTREFLSSVADSGKPVPKELTNAREMLAAILHDCDLAKFAGAPLSKSEMEKIAGQVADFIRATRPGRENDS